MDNKNVPSREASSSSSSCQLWGRVYCVNFPYHGSWSAASIFIFPQLAQALHRHESLGQLFFMFYIDFDLLRRHSWKNNWFCLCVSFFAPWGSHLMLLSQWWCCCSCVNQSVIKNENYMQIWYILLLIRCCFLSRHLFSPVLSLSSTLID